MAMFATLFLGVVLSVFLTLGVVSADAERGLLQPLVVRPLGRSSLLVGRFVAAALVCTVYVLAVFGAAVLITGAAGDWWPDRIAGPGLQLAGAVVIVASARSARCSTPRP
jgi:ABC-type transport system involved in multi-copper enzyme maturation permease subunit